jgi:hypothetical protein
MQQNAEDDPDRVRREIAGIALPAGHKELVDFVRQSVENAGRRGSRSRAEGPVLSEAEGPVLSPSTSLGINSAEGPFHQAAGAPVKQESEHAVFKGVQYLIAERDAEKFRGRKGGDG